LNVIALRESAGLPLDEFERHLGPHGVERATLRRLLDTFALTHTTGSLTRVSQVLGDELPALTANLSKALDSGDLYAHEAAKELLPLVMQAAMLAMQVDAVVANPPYMGGKGMNPALKEFAKSNFPDSKADLFAMFMERGFEWCKPTGFNSMVTMQSWMFLSSFESMRIGIISEKTIFNLLQIGYNSFPEMNSKIAQATAFCVFSTKIPNNLGAYTNLNSVPQSADKNEVFLGKSTELTYKIKQENFGKIPGQPIAYWISENLMHVFSFKPISNKYFSDGLTKTGDNSNYLRYFWEVSINKARDPLLYRTCFKGGDFCRYYGNTDNLIKWDAKTRQHYQEKFCRSY